MDKKRLSNGTKVKFDGEILTIVGAIKTNNQFCYGKYLYRFNEKLNTGFGLYSHEFEVIKKNNFLKRLFCKIGWHSQPVGYNSLASQYAECKWCKYKGMVDSQGNLF